MLRDVDARLLLPLVPKTARVLPGAAEFAPGLAEAGVELVDGDDESYTTPDVVVASADEADSALRLPARSFLFVGGPVSSLAREHGLEAEDYLAVPDVCRAAFLIPLRRRNVMRYLYRRLRVAPSKPRWLRSKLLASAVSFGAPPGARAVTIAAPDTVKPATLAAAEQLVGGAGDGWLLCLGPVRTEGSVVFQVFDGDVPRFVVKCERMPKGNDLDRSPPTFSLVDAIAASALVEGHAPQPLGSVRFEGGDLEIETAAVGYVLTERLRGPFSREAKLANIDAVATWLLALAESTRHHREPTVADLAPPELDDVPRVLCHGDLWSGNVVVEDDCGFQVVDWSDVQASGLPFGDLLLFLSEALAELDGVHTEDGRDRYFVELMTGQRHSSTVLFGWVLAMADALGLDSDLVGLVAQTAFAAMAEHRLLLEGFGPCDPRRGTPPAMTDPVVRRACLWTSTPGLGRDWYAWRHGVGKPRARPRGMANSDGVAMLRRGMRRGERRLGHGASRLAGFVSRDQSEELERARVLVLAPHPDDETLACGGVLARHRGRDSAFVIVVSDGSRGVYGGEPAALAAQRHGELDAATAALGLEPGQVAWWGFEDGTLSSHVDELADRLAQALDDLSPTVVLSPWAYDVHPDHAALGRAARTAAADRPVQLLEYVVWAWDRPSALVRSNRRPGTTAILGPSQWLQIGRPVAVATAPGLEAKRAALACYGSQLGGPGSVSNQASVPPDLVELFLSRDELFWPVGRPQSPGV